MSLPVANLVGVALVLVCGVLHSSYLVFVEPWNSRRALSQQNRYEAALASAASSGVVNWRVLSFYRIALFVYALSVGIWQIIKLGFWPLAYYTVWNWWLLTLYFLLSGALTHISKGGSTHRSVPGPLPTCCEVLFHINITTSAFLDTVTWTILYPMVTSTSPEAKVFFDKMFFNFISYNQHGFNAVMMLGDLALSAMTMQVHNLGYICLWSFLFTNWAFIFYIATGRWQYPFLDLKLPGAPLAYLGLYLAHWVFFILVMGVYRLKTRFLTRAAPTTTHLTHTQDTGKQAPHPIQMQPLPGGESPKAADMGAAEPEGGADAGMAEANGKVGLGSVGGASSGVQAGLSGGGMQRRLVHVTDPETRA